jgi:hypothetical protein
MELMEIVAVNRYQGHVLLSDWETQLPMMMFDAEGDETDDGEQAVTAVVCLGDDLYLTIDLDAWERPTLH